VAAGPAAPQAAPARPAAPPASYVSRLSSALERAKRYPTAARLRRQEGTGVLTFSMRGDGTVTGWRLVRGTGHAELDEEILAMIQRASPLPAPPPEMGDPVTLTVPVRFSVR
ncbi:energy transducer TonB family protein, partial [Teichococcus aestuarii]|uniref:energy transducer TonB family protein n=1 Tax=Teichococcus aestuarii TaxID=568898 RepID=UPI00361F3884